jgi:hypothetical protein
VTAFATADTAVLVKLRANLLEGLALASSHLEAGTLDVPPGPKAVPPRETAHLTLGLFEAIDFELSEHRGVASIPFA